MDLLNRLGGLQKITFGKLTDLVIGERYLIDKWVTTTSQFGRQVAILLGNTQYNLPHRFHTLTDEELTTYNAKRIFVIYKGKKKFGNYQETALLEFAEE